jgi:hypothetical protein
VELQSRLGELNAQGLGLAVVTYDPPAILADFARRRGITFPLLSDAGSRTIKAYGILNTTVAEETRKGIPFPGTFLIDRSGHVKSRFFEEAYQERNTVSTIMIAVGTSKTPAEARRIETDHLAVTTYVSDEVVAPGSLFTVVFDVNPRPGIHVYAPGAMDYKRINFRIDANPILSAEALQYPRSEIYHFKHDLRHARVPGVRRSTVLHATVDSRLPHRQTPPTRHRSRDRAEMKPYSVT